MIEVRQYRKDLNLSGYDMVYETADEFQEVLPFMKPKLEGGWSIMVLEPRLEFVRTCLDTGLIPSYVSLTLAVEGTLLEQLYLERPRLLNQEKTPWQLYMALIAKFPNRMEDKAMRELYYRVGPNEEKLAEALHELESVPYVTVKEIDKRWAPVQRVYANQVVRTFLLGRSRDAWKQLKILEDEIGPTVSFYAMRKAVRRLYNAKQKYLSNQPTKERNIENISIYDITLLYWHFETATSPLQLYPILQLYERRQQPHACCQ